MNEQRFVVSDVLWHRFEPHILDKVSDAGATAKDNRVFLETLFCGCAPGRRGATYRLPLAVGTVNSGAFAGGPSPGYLRVFSKL